MTSIARYYKPHEDHRAHAKGNFSKCSRTKTPSGCPCSPAEVATEKSCSRAETENGVLRSSSKTISPPLRPLEHVANSDFRKQLELSVPLHRPGEWKYELKTSSLTTTILNLIFAEAEHKGKTQHFRMYIGPRSAGSSAVKLSLDLKFHSRNTALPSRPEWHSMSKTVFTELTHTNPGRRLIIDQDVV